MHHVGKTIRNIRIIDELGIGGMGQVYVGIDERLGRRVAVKAVRPERRLDQRARARFLREAQILSRLEHPSICRIYDFIEHEGNDFIVLELVHGDDLGRLAQTEIGFADRLDIAMQICRALVAAHGMGIIHRDLKPQNVMVDTEGQVKVLDFGLARARSSVGGDSGKAADGTAPGSMPVQAEGTTTLTALGDIVGTPRAMSPEQARGEEITAASDLFSFGLILQELFTGKRPYPEDLPPPDLHRKVMWADTLPVTGVDSEITELVERLTLLSPGERPTAVEALQRLQSIHDRPRRRLRRIAVTGVATGLVVAAAALSVALWQTRSSLAAARAAQADALREAATAREVSEFLVSLFSLSDPGEARGETITAREILDTGARRIEEELRDQPLVRATMMHTIGRVYDKLGLYEEALVLLQTAAQDRESLLGPTHPELVLTLEAMSTVSFNLGRYDEAEALLLRVLEMREQSQMPVEVAVTHSSLGGVYGQLGRLEEARAQYDRALALFNEHTDMETGDVATVSHNLARLLLSLGETDEAEKAARRALAIDERLYGDTHHLVAADLSTLGSILWTQDRLDEAREPLERAHAIFTKVLGPDHARVGDSLNLLAALALRGGDLTMAEERCRRAVAIHTHAYGADHPYVGDVLGNLGVIVDKQGRHEEAITTYREALAISENAHGASHPSVASTLLNLAVAYRALGSYAEAETAFLRALTIREAEFGEDSRPVAEVLERYAVLLRATGRSEEAEQAEARARTAPGR